MNIHLIAVGKRMPAWVSTAYEEYSKRLPSDYALRLIEIDAGKRASTHDLARLIKAEGEQMLAAIPSGSRVIALDVKGQAWDTSTLSKRLEQWHETCHDVSLLVGGPEGLATDCLTRADTKWSLSPLTLPHPLVRVVVAEQLYRAWSILANHPYHR
jgi:23S rRNA (pseudouridine1915-N3)-methyltransferase